MKTAKFKFDGKNYNVVLEGNFEFKLTDEILEDITNLDTVHKIYFGINKKVMADIKLYCENEERYYEQIGNQLKTDFINFLKTI